MWNWASGIQTAADRYSVQECGERMALDSAEQLEVQQQPYGFLDEARGSLRNSKMPNSVTATTATIHAVTVTM